MIDQLHKEIRMLQEATPTDCPTEKWISNTTAISTMIALNSALIATLSVTPYDRDAA